MKNSLKWAVCAGICAFSANAANAQTFAISSAGDYGGSHANYPASNAIDGNTDWSSRWAANNSGDASNLYIDFGSVQRVDDIGVAWGRGDQRTHTFEVRARAGTSGSWDLIYSGTSSGTTTDIEQYNVTDIDAQQVRIKVFSNSAGTNWTNVTEFEAYGTAGPDGTDTGTETGAVSVPAVIEAEEYTGYYDNDTTNRGGDYRTSEGVDVQDTGDTSGVYNVGWFYTGEWLEYEINVSSASNYEVDLRLSTIYDSKTFSISVDGSDVTGDQSITNTGNWESYYTESGVDIGYLSTGDHTIRLTATNGGFNVNWLEFSESDGDGGSNGDLDPSLPPSGNFDLDQWKITLPESEISYLGEGDDDAAEILPGDCTSVEYDDYSGPGLNEGFEDSDYFYTGTDGSMVFVTPLNDGATTITSSYARSELRELYEWDPAVDCDGDGDANWSPSGTHTLSGTMNVVDYYDDDPQTIVGQIHAKDSSKALLKLQWDGPSDNVRAIINESPAEDEDTDFSVNFDAVPGTDEWSYVIELEDDTMSITVIYNGVSETQSLTFGDELSGDWGDHVYYFKAGNYAQANVGNNGSFEVRFTALEVEHSN